MIHTKFYQNFHIVTPYWAPKGTSPFIYTNMNHHLLSMFPTKFGWNWPIGSWAEIV